MDSVIDETDDDSGSTGISEDLLEVFYERATEYQDILEDVEEL